MLIKMIIIKMINSLMYFLSSLILPALYIYISWHFKCHLLFRYYVVHSDLITTCYLKNQLTKNEFLFVLSLSC